MRLDRANLRQMFRFVGSLDHQPLIEMQLAELKVADGHGTDHSAVRATAHLEQPLPTFPERGILRLELGGGK